MTAFQPWVLGNDVSLPAVEGRLSFGKILRSVGVQVMQSKLEKEMALVEAAKLRAEGVAEVEELDADV